MCGFVGVVHSAPRERVSADGLAGLLADLRHRGPDGVGVETGEGWGLAAARLAIQGDVRGAQPLTSRDGRIVAVFNGEILDSARSTLARLVRAAGLEVPDARGGDGPLLAEALAALARLPSGIQGPGLMVLLEGSMGAVALRDREREDTWLVRDRLGVKPLFALPTEDGLLFASEIRPLLRAVPAARRADPDGLAELLHFQRPVRHLPFAGVETLLPGAAWRVDPRGRVTRWSGGAGIRDLVDRSTLSPGESVAELGHAWRASAADAARGANAALFLSGGLDSGAVAATAEDPDLIALTGRFPPPGGPLDESAAAAEVAEVAGLTHLVQDLFDGDLVEDVPTVVRSLEIPMAGPGALALWRLAARVHAAGRRVVLTGTGGDELLGGYARTAVVLGRTGRFTEGYEPLARRVDDAGSDLVTRQRAVLDRSGDLAPLLHPDFARGLPSPEPPGVVARHGATDQDPISALVDDEVEGTLPMLLHVEDRILMAHGLEGRPVPCLGGVARAAARVPPDWLVGPDGEGKRALRAFAEGLVPERVRLDPVKRGFPTPFARAARGAGRRDVEAVLEDPRFRERGWWNVMACRAALADPRPIFDRALYALLSWEFWARAFLDGDALTPEERA